jgi:hypothetical protein
VLAAYIIAMMVEAANTSETSVKLYRAIRRNIAEDNRLKSRRHENLEYHGIKMLREDEMAVKDCEQILMVRNGIKTVTN